MERSRASNCPTAAYQLVGTKKIQQALAEPGVLERSALSELFCPLTELSRLVVHYVHLAENLSGKTISSRIKNWGLGMTRNVVHQAKTYSIPWQYPISQYIHTYIVSEPFPQYASTGYCYWRQRCSARQLLSHNHGRSCSVILLDLSTKHWKFHTTNITHSLDAGLCACT